MAEDDYTNIQIGPDGLPVSGTPSTLIYGCLDSSAVNYDPMANISDTPDSCVYGSPVVTSTTLPVGNTLVTTSTTNTGTNTATTSQNVGLFISNPSGVGASTILGGVTTNGIQAWNGFTLRPARGENSNQNATIFIENCQDVYVQEKHLTVIRKGPTSPVTLEMFSYTREDQNNDDQVDIEAEWHGDDTGATHTAVDGSRVSIFYDDNKNRKTAGNSVVLPIANDSSGTEDFKTGDILIISHEFTDYLGVKQEVSCRVVIEFWSGMSTWTQCKLLSNPIGFPLETDESDLYTATLVQDDPMFKLKFPRFSYRYKYEDGEYSVFAPWSQVAFIPQEFDYLPKKGYNLGMVNNLRYLKIKDWAPKSMPKDVVQIDLLYKESNSPNVYTVESFKKDDEIELGSGEPFNYWNSPGTGENYGNYIVTSELIHATVPSNQMLRPWDNVPRKALAQDITANRLIFANYLQNYDVKTFANEKNELKPNFQVIVDHISPLGTEKLPAKSLKSMRSYQIGIVYRDRYGRETPVLTSKTGIFKLKKEHAPLYNRLSVGMSTQAPDWAESFTYYIKETSNEYYNVAMDRWYDAEDGGVWVSFPSSERNKIKEDGVLILKKQHDTDIAVTTDEEYKVIDVKNSAPTFIKTDTQYWGNAPMMLPPPGWAIGGRPGGWQSGMFAPSGIPRRNRIYLDVYKEYVEATILGGVKAAVKDGVEVRIIQTPGQMSSLTSRVTTKTNKSDWYKVASMNQVGEDPETYVESELDPTDPNQYIETEVEVAGSAHPVMRMSLEKRMGDDMLFTEPDGSLDLARGLSLEVRTHKVRDKAQFEGRFFVKLFKSNDLITNIINPTNKESEDLVVVDSRGVKYICDGHPGVQDWSYMTPTATPTTVATPYTNFIPPGVNIYQYRQGQGGNKGYDSWTNINNNTGGRPYSIVSSYGYGVPADTPFVDPGGALRTQPDGTKPTLANLPGNMPHMLWPFGPGPVEADSMDPNFPTGFQGSVIQQQKTWVGLPGTGGWAGGSWWSNKYKEHINSLSDGFPYFYNPRQEQRYGWPSYFPSAWEPSLNTDGTDLTSISQISGRALGDTWGVFMSTTALVDQNSALNTLNGPRTNPYLKPAIWGDNDAELDRTKPSYEFNASTITKLNRDWMGYYNKGTGGESAWPKTKIAWHRWFIDKVGAAQGYSGHGIFEDINGVSRMSISYWGIGASDDRTDRNPWDLSANQPDEVPFANAMSSVGTMFRFKQDPDQIVYTITKAEIELVYNYEANRGGWGCDEKTGGPFQQGGGSFSIFKPNSGSVLCNDRTGIGGKAAFFSDLYNDSTTAPYGGHWKATGRHFTNNRLRINVTLDKAIGGGPNGFHPITNHVDINGIANIEKAHSYGAHVRYDSNGASHITVEKGGTDTSVQSYWMYNLASYWNVDSTARALVATNNYYQPSDSSDTFYTNNPNAYIGLHERGMNQTTIEILDYFQDENKEKRMSNNPGVWETEPKEDVGLDIYYAASPSFPVNTKRFRFDTDEEKGWNNFNLRGEEFIKVNSTAKMYNPSKTFTSKIDGVQGNTVWLNTHINEDSSVPPNPIAPPDNSIIEFTYNGEGTFYGAGQDVTYVRAKVIRSITPTILILDPNVHNQVNQTSLDYFNCYSFGNGVESNRIRDDFNAVTIDKGVKASAPLAEGYEEERKKSSFIFSGIYNSTSGINSVNQFIQAEPITKDLNPIHGSIQKIFARDTDLITFCENKVFKILAKKDALFNADGNTNVTANKNVLGQTIPFSGEYGISRNPESFAAESYRVYFTDKDRGTVMRLSKDGLTPISDKGMKDWFKDNLINAGNLIGSFDSREDHYNLSIETRNQDNIISAYTLTFTESKGSGWESFKSFIKQGGISYKNKYYTFPSNKYNSLPTEIGSKARDLYGDHYGVDDSDPLYLEKRGTGDMWQHHVDLDFHRTSSRDVSGGNTIRLTPGFGSLISGMNVEGNGIPDDTIIEQSIAGGMVLNLNNTEGTGVNVYISNGEELRFTTPRNNFYQKQSHSMVRTLLNGAQGSVKRFKTINYEGTQGKVLGETTTDFYTLSKGNNSPINVGRIYSNNYPKKGWEVTEIKTDLQDGSIQEFVEKENKWFNYIRGFEDAGSGDDFDTSEFSTQGLGFTNL